MEPDVARVRRSFSAAAWVAAGVSSAVVGWLVWWTVAMGLLAALGAMSEGDWSGVSDAVFNSALMAVPGLVLGLILAPLGFPGVRALRRGERGRATWLGSAYFGALLIAALVGLGLYLSMMKAGGI